jgi:hypothetical protein
VSFAGAPLPLVGAAFAVGGAALVALYVLKLRRRRVEVPFSHLWRKVVRDTESVALWRRLRRLLSLCLQLLLLALVLGALGDPRLGASTRGRSRVILVDTSASMQATDGDSAHHTRLETAREAARRLVREMGGQDVALVVAMDARPTPLGGWESDDRELLRQIDALGASDTPADLERALKLGADALRGRPHPELVLVGDGAYDEAVLGRVRFTPPRRDDLGAIDLSGIDLRFVPIGRSHDNVGITAFAVRRYQANQTAYEVLVELQSFRDHPSSVKLELVQDGEVVEVEPLELGAGQRVQRLYPNLSGDGTRLTAHLVDAHDALPLDDRAYALLPPRRKLKVLLVTAGDLFLEGALLLDENLEVEKIAPAAWDARKAARFDALVFDRFTPPRDDPPPANALYIAPEGPGSPFAVRGTVDAPLLTEVAERHPLMRWVTLKDLNIARAARFVLEPGDVAVASAQRDPIIVARERDGKKTVAVGFDLSRSDLPLRVAFPVLVVNALDWFGGSDGGLIASFATGHPFRVPAAGGTAELTVRGPDGQVAHAPVHEGRATLYAARAGYYELGGTPSSLVAANLASPSESRIAPRATLTVDGRALAPPEPGRAGLRRTLWSYLVALALGLLCLEWWTYNRRVTV